MSDSPDEFSLIERYFAPLSSGAIGALRLKDDVATLSIPEGHELVITTDAIVENVHFLSDDPSDLIARKALRVNLSDLTAKAADPFAYLLSLALPRHLADDAWLGPFARGLGEDQAIYGVHLIGGDTVATSGPLVINVTALGTVPQGAAVRRVGAQPGDKLFVTGSIGDGLLGLRALTGALDTLDPVLREDVVTRYRLPQPRVAFGPALRGVASASMDVSDGLVADIGHLAAASGVAAVLHLHRIPLGVAARAWADDQTERLFELATGGDDYEILFSVPPAKADDVVATAHALGVPISEIGVLEPGEGVSVVALDGQRLPAGKAGFNHF